MYGAGELRAVLDPPQTYCVKAMVFVSDPDLGLLKFGEQLFCAENWYRSALIGPSFASLEKDSEIRFLRDLFPTE